MSFELGAQLAVCEVPDLHAAIPRARDDGGHQGVGGEPDAGDPPAVTIAGAKVPADGILALAEGVPELDCVVTRRGDDLAVIDGEGDGEDVLGVADEAAGGGPGGEVPEAELAVPGPGERELAVGAEDDVLDEVGVAGEAAERDAVLRRRRVGVGGDGGGRVGDVPHHQRLVTGGGDDEGRVVDRRGDRGHHVVVAAQDARQGERLLAGHFRRGGGFAGSRRAAAAAAQERRKRRRREADGFIVGRSGGLGFRGASDRRFGGGRVDPHRWMRSDAVFFSSTTNAKNLEHSELQISLRAIFKSDSELENFVFFGEKA
uniref:Uncharacterized protein n=1 Tax=Oryza brachyantha TaxID=4533 RepID=J3M9I1_ORYBR